MQAPDQSGENVSISTESRQKTPRQKVHRDPLHLRIYFHRHLTAFVRLFGHQELTIDEAREKLRPLIEEFGIERIEEAAAEILMTVRYHPEQTVRLLGDVRRLAQPLIGPPPEKGEEKPSSFQEMLKSEDRQTPATDAHQDNSHRDDPGTTSTPEAVTVLSHIDSPISSVEANQPSRKLISLPIREVRMHFENWLKDNGQKVLVMTPDQRAGFSDNRLSTLDVIVYGEEQHRLVTVRRKITKLQIHDMLEWQKVFGSDFHPYTVWPHMGSDGWTWVYHPLPAESS